MVGLVLVSHSAKLAEGVAELARGMAGPEVKIAATGGMDLPDHPLGTDTGLILKGIDQVYSDDGVLVLMDLGSAVLSSEMALDELTPDRRARIALCEAPFVEGAIAAAVQARLGAPLEQVKSEALGALFAKQTHFQEQDQQPTPAAPSALAPSSSPSHILRLTVQNSLGLHARPAARFVQTAARYDADLRVRNLTAGRGPVSAKSINGVTTLGVLRGHEIEVSASGADAASALEAVRALADSNFGDNEIPASQPIEPLSTLKATQDKVQTPAALSPRLVGLAASSGIAIGPARHFRPTLPDIPTTHIDDPSREWETLLIALGKTRAQINSTRAALGQRVDRDTAAIFDAHLLFLDDEALLTPARQKIYDEKLNAAAAWQFATSNVADEYRALDDPYLRQRAADVEDVGRQVLFNLLGDIGPQIATTASGILIADDIAPAQTANLDPSQVLGICTAFGSPTAHSAILARSLGIPAVVGLGPSLLDLEEGTLLIVDGNDGVVWTSPEQKVIDEYAQRQARARAARDRARASSDAPAITRDGRRIEIAANIGSAADARQAVASGAEGVGLFRTEFMFLDRKTAPDEEEQYSAYRAVAQELGNRPLIIRTLDAGGDKPLPYLDLPHEANPFLGYRAVRISLAQPDFFKTQLRAIVRVAAEFPVKVMFPMIATVVEWRAAREFWLQARTEVEQLGEQVSDRTELGVMIEIPAAALHAADLAREVDFFSIGTNDLTQYTLAAERGNPRVASIADPLDPAVLQLIARVVQAAHARDKWVGVCGEMAGDLLAAPLLVGLGVDELSMNAPAIPEVKQLLRELDYQSVREQAEAALALETAEEVRSWMNSKMNVNQMPAGLAVGSTK